MGALQAVTGLLGSLMITPFLMFILCIIFLASFGKSLGVRRLYVSLLIKIFEFGRANIESAKKQSALYSDVGDDCDRNDSGVEQLSVPSITANGHALNGKTTAMLNGCANGLLPTSATTHVTTIQSNSSTSVTQSNGTGAQTLLCTPIIGGGDNSSNSNSNSNSSNSSSSVTTPKHLPRTNSNGNTVISRDALILVPDAEYNNYTSKEITSVRSNGSSASDSEGQTNAKNTDETPTGKDQQQQADEQTFDFDLSNCLDYVKAGMEAIIEDEVTSRFEAEELKNWNLLTRTNSNYEFISWRLTVIWVCGFFVRYIVLMPLRVFICFVGVVWAVVSFAIIGCIPFRSLRHWLNDRSFKILFRLIARSLSAVINIHSSSNKPQNCGFCVANHTSPIDIAILSTDCSYSLVLWLTLCTALVGCVPEGPTKYWLVRKISIQCFGVLSSAISAVITYHNEENRPASGICVANHTSPIDALVLMCNNCYSLIGQRHGGFLGILQRALARASPHIWFERAEAKDREAVAQRLRKHVSNPRNPPILIFPEGTCINNTSVMQFKKGSFEVGGVIYPVAIKYDPRFGDAFWNSSRYSMMQYLYMMMTSWAIVCDVWYLPPMYRQEGESAIDFANRVKSVIAKQGGLVDLMWDGQLKRMKPKKEWKERQQEEFTKRLKGE